MNTNIAKKLLRGTYYEHSTDFEIQLLINRLQPFEELLVERVIENQNRMDQDEKASSHSSKTLLRKAGN